MSDIKELRNNIAASLFMIPCTEEELLERDFLKNRSLYGVQGMIQWLETDEAIYYRGDIIHIKKSWAKTNLAEYELDFRSERQKFIDSLTPFQKEFYGYK